MRNKSPKRNEKTNESVNVIGLEETTAFSLRLGFKEHFVRTLSGHPYLSDISLAMSSYLDGGFSEHG